MEEEEQEGEGGGERYLQGEGDKSLRDNKIHISMFSFQGNDVFLLTKSRFEQTYAASVFLPHGNTLKVDQI